MWKLSDYLGRLQKCANLSVSEGAPFLSFRGGGFPNHLGTALIQSIIHSNKITKIKNLKPQQRLFWQKTAPQGNKS